MRTANAVPFSLAHGLHGGMGSTAYMDASGKRHAAGVTLRKRIEVGALTIDRIVGNRYEWRDGRYKVRRVVVYDDGG